MNHLGGKKQAKRKTRKDISILKSLQNNADNTKDILDLLKEKLLDDASSTWYQGELLYIVSISRRKASGADVNAANSYVSEASNVRQARYLTIFRKAESPQGTSMLRIFRKDAELEVKHSHEMSKLRSIDYGAEDNELVLSFEQADYSMYFAGQLDRDETLWIISQVFKAISGNELTIGYSVDIDALSYMMTTSGSMARFPPLQKLISMNCASVGDRFTADEAQAEQILDHLQWNKSLSEQMDIHQMLSANSEKLNHEIIDFLLQWEEMDNTASQMKSTPVGSSVATKVFGLKDTKEVLIALADVDGQLETVDKWLGDQIEHLAEIQSNLHMIEDESGALEVSWQNLNIVQDVVTNLVSKYSLEEEQEALLLAPEKSLQPVLKLNSLQQIDRYIQPLTKAAASLRNALNIKATDLCGLTTTQWKQIQGINAITSQKKRLINISESFCSKLGEWAINLFDWLLKHKALVEGEGKSGGAASAPAAGSGSAAGGTGGLLPRQFPTARAAVEEICFMKYDGFINPTNVNKFRLPRSKYRSPERNQLLESQAAYHAQVTKFASLLNLMVELQSTFSRPMCEAYMRATFDRLYGPLVKAFSKDMQALVSCKVAPLSLSSCVKFRADVASNLLMRFDSRNNNQARVLTSWRVFEVALLLIAPMIDNEEAFIKKTFHLDGRRPEGSNQTANHDIATDAAMTMVVDAKTFAHSRLHSLLLGVFENLIPRLLTFSNSTSTNAAASETDGVEAIAMLTVLTEFSSFYQDPSSRSSVLVSSDAGGRSNSMAGDGADGEGSSSAFFSAMVFADLRAALEHRVHAFTNEQINWITAQKGDPKTAGVFAPFCRFPTLVLHIIEMLHEQQFDCVDDLLHKIAKEMFSWLSAVANTSDKYADKVKITNFTFFLQSMSALQLPTLRNFVLFASQQVRDATSKYLHWMVEYEFPSLSALATRIEGVSNKVSDEELSLYIRRKDVLNVVKELENRTLDSMVVNLRKRVEKHFRSEFDIELRLVDGIWTQLKDRVVSILAKLETAANISYQINLDIGSKQLSQAFEKQQLSGYS